MKNIIFLLVGIVSIMLAGCGEEASTEGAASVVSSPTNSSSTPEPLAVDSLPSIPSLPEG